MSACLFRNGSSLDPSLDQFSKVFRIEYVLLNLCTCYGYVPNTYPYMGTMIKNSLRVIS